MQSWGLLSTQIAQFVPVSGWKGRHWEFGKGTFRLGLVSGTAHENRESCWDEASGHTQEGFFPLKMLLVTCGSSCVRKADLWNEILAPEPWRVRPSLCAWVLHGAGAAVPVPPPTLCKEIHNCCYQGLNCTS